MDNPSVPIETHAEGEKKLDKEEITLEIEAGPSSTGETSFGNLKSTTHGT